MKPQHMASLSLLVALTTCVPPAPACTGLRLIADDGTVVFGRTQEWGTFDLKSRVVIIPRNHALATKLPDGKQGVAWKTKYGFLAVDAFEEDILVDGMNEKGLLANLFYHEGFAEYAEYEPAKAESTITIQNLAPYLISTCATVKEARAALAGVTVIGVPVGAIGSVPPAHMMMTDRSGESIVVEFTNGVTTVYDAPLGVITNGPNYDWQVTNLLNHTSLDEPLPHRTLKDLASVKFGAGARLYGLPGDLTSPSRFLRVAAYSATARKVPDGTEGMYELFRILDNFNLTIGTSAAEGGGEVNQEGMRSSTIWTTAFDTKDLILYYHTMHNRRVRKLDLSHVNLDATEIVRLPLDRRKSQDMEDITPKPPLAGGWSDAEVDPIAEQAVEFVLSRMNSSAKLRRIVRVKRQVVKGMNYDLTFEMDDGAVWNAIVYRDLSGEFSITKTSKAG